MKNFAITGVAGYIAPRHLKAIKETGNRLEAALDPHDSVGILDQFFPEVSFFTEFERFDRHLDKLRRGPKEGRIEYVSICSPNNLHDAHIRLAMRIGAHAICEKPMVLNPWNLDALQLLEEESGRKVFTVLQLRVHPALVDLKETLEKTDRNCKRQVCLTYVTARGPWYHYSWKGSIERSGGLATNIGIHFFDLLLWIFGDVQRDEIHLSEPRRMGGFLELQRANVRWFLSIAREDLPRREVEQGKSTYRSITVDDKEIEFSDSFGDLHTTLCKQILLGGGFGIQEARPSINLVHRLRNSTVVHTRDIHIVHPFIK